MLTAAPTEAPRQKQSLGRFEHGLSRKQGPRRKRCLEPRLSVLSAEKKAQENDWVSTPSFTIIIHPIPRPRTLPFDTAVGIGHRTPGTDRRRRPPLSRPPTNALPGAHPSPARRTSISNEKGCRVLSGPAESTLQQTQVAARAHTHHRCSSQMQIKPSLSLRCGKNRGLPFLAHAIVREVALDQGAINAHGVGDCSDAL